MIYIIEIILFILVLVVTKIHAYWYDNNKPIYWWWHSVWVLPFLVVIGWYFFRSYDWLGSVILLIERLIFFNVFLNLFRHKPFFYLHGESQNGSWWDRQLEKLNGYWEYVWLFLFISFVLIQFKL